MRLRKIFKLLVTDKETNKYRKTMLGKNDIVTKIPHVTPLR